ncbi:hypothetical protein E2C01_012138 [Portunus trituberculatus]|uniref:Uncharacterized protein n=1 Tax=Portunus trituberculatus TaxID=210409 RepID=A0A5B7DDD1_PORTR|nr:hypothetical protein [Portunus trituberculatus]
MGGIPKDRPQADMSPLTPSVPRRVSICLLLTVWQFHTTSEIHVGD